MPDLVAQRLTELPQLSKPALQELWKELFATQAPPHLRRHLMVPILAYRIQEQALGPLSESCQRRLHHLAQAIEAGPKTALRATPGIKPGTRLVREWQNKVYVVHVEKEGYEYNGFRYDNLSEIARLITGARWSGPLFFGLKSNRADKSKEAA
jgi:hypothetical protein